MYTKFTACSKHETPYPMGSICPKCEVEFTKRQDATKLPHWEAFVPHYKRKEFLTDERLYCQAEETAFTLASAYNESKQQIEYTRTLVLEKRHEFLKMYMDQKYMNNELPNQEMSLVTFCQTLPREHKVNEQRRQIAQTIALLSSMVYGGENHSSTSEEQVRTALDNLTREH